MDGGVVRRVAVEGPIRAERLAKRLIEVDAELLEERLLAVVELQPRNELGARAGEERGQALVLLRVVDDRLLEVGAELRSELQQDRAVAILADDVLVVGGAVLRLRPQSPLGPPTGE